MNAHPVTIFFDVNETLSDLATVADAFEHVGATRTHAAAWFATVLRDGFALTASQTEASFATIARNNAQDLLSKVELNQGLEGAVEVVLTAFATVGVHPDVAAGLRALDASGHRLFTLSNGPTSTARRLLTEAGVLDAFDDLLTVDGHSLWKPSPDSYRDALARTGIEGPAYLVAVHPWDVHGAAKAGLSTVWVNRSGAVYPDHFHSPTVTVTALTELADIDLAELAHSA
jgi:2-haloacid dehalogenase